jgi:twinkle protein
MRTYEVEQTTDGEVLFPYHNKIGETIAFKVRGVDKTFKVEGDWKGATLFGQSRFQQGGKVLSLTEGEFDALAVHQMTSLPAVSVRSGAQGALADCKAAFEWIDSFDKVVICFDNDEPGKEATKKVAELLGSKACMFRHHNDYKDACEWLAHKSEAQFSNAWHGADAYKPEGIVTVTDIKERLLAPPVAGVPWCFDTLTEVTYGRRKGELYAFGAGVGVGKTDVFTQQIAYDIDKLGSAGWCYLP